MIEIARRARNQPAPPHIVRAALADPNGGTGRTWFVLAAGEQWPSVLEGDERGDVLWSSLWPAHPSAVVCFTLRSDGGGGTDLEWTLLMDEPGPDTETTAALRHRLNYLINGEMRYSFGQ